MQVGNVAPSRATKGLSADLAGACQTCCRMVLGDEVTTSAGLLPGVVSRTCALQPSTSPRWESRIKRWLGRGQTVRRRSRGTIQRHRRRSALRRTAPPRAAAQRGDRIVLRHPPARADVRRRREADHAARPAASRYLRHARRRLRHRRRCCGGTIDCGRLHGARNLHGHRQRLALRPHPITRR